MEAVATQRAIPPRGVNPGIGFFQPNDKHEQPGCCSTKVEMRADDATGVPRYTYGNGGRRCGRHGAGPQHADEQRGQGLAARHR